MKYLKLLKDKLINDLIKLVGGVINGGKGRNYWTVEKKVGLI